MAYQIASTKLEVIYFEHTNLENSKSFIVLIYIDLRRRQRMRQLPNYVNVFKLKLYTLSVDLNMFFWRYRWAKRWSFVRIKDLPTKCPILGKSPLQNWRKLDLPAFKGTSFFNWIFSFIINRKKIMSLFNSN